MVVYGKLAQGKWKRKYCSAATRRFSDNWKSHPLVFLCVRVFMSSTFWLLQFNVLSTMNRLMMFGFSLFLPNKCCSISLRCCYIVYSFCPNFEQCTYYFGKKRVWHWKVTAEFLQWARQKSFEQNFFTNEMKCNQHLSVSLSFFLILPRYWIFVCAWVFLMDFLTFCIFIVQPNQFERLSIHAFCICVVISFLYEQIISDQSRKMKKTHRTCAQSNSYYYCLIKKKNKKE